MPINRKIITIIIAVFAIALLAGCNAQDKEVEKKPAVQETEVREETQIDEKPAVKVPQEETSPVTLDKETVPDEVVSDVKNAVEAQYVKVKKCKTCHIKQFRSWDKTKMATSFENLKPGKNTDAKKKAGLDPGKDYTHDPFCLKCHTTGYDKPGGFVSLEKTPGLINVQCEACHGPGGKYNLIMKKHRKTFKVDELIAVGFVVLRGTSAEKECLVCHGDDNPFNEKIDPKYKWDFKERSKNAHQHSPLKYKH